MKGIQKFLFLIVIAGAFSACSTQKNTFVNRNYHAINTYYNGYFNANESFEEGRDKVLSAHKENYKKILPIYIYPSETTSKSIYPEMDKAIKKCSRVIQRHSMDNTGAEVNKWIDDSYLLIGKCYFYKQEYDEARVVFKYVQRRYKKSNSYYPNALWLVRNHIHTENFYDAKKLLEDLDKDKKKPLELKEEFNATYAYYYMSQENYEKAIIHLKDAVEVCKKKKRQTRWMFILAQLYQQTKESLLADKYYKEVEKRSLNYELTFYSQLNRAFAFDAEVSNSYEVKETLLKMAKDDKNIEYLDQIYYGLADIYLKEGDEERGIQFLNLSTESSVNNNEQKGISFLRLGEIYFEKPEYSLAQLNYDSAVTYLPKDYEDYESILALKNNLTKIVENILIVETQDSLQRLASMSEEDRLTFIEDYIEEEKLRKEEEKREKERLEQERKDAEGTKRLDDPLAEGNTEWYFYNTTIMEYGRSEFTRIWGSRANEDNWRRSDKSSQSLSFDQLNEGNTGVVGGADDNPEKYLAFLPLDSTSMIASHQKIQKALFDLGNTYKENMNDNPNAIKSFEELLSRYDSSDYHLTTYYLLYRLWKAEGNSSKSNYYKNIILSQYADSDYAKLILNPDYLKELALAKAEAELFYEKTYGYYDRGFYLQTKMNCIEAYQKFAETPLIPKFKLLEALSIGGSTGKDSLITSLTLVAGNYGSTDEGKYAQELIGILTAKPAQEEVSDAPEYSTDLESKHLFVVIFNVEDIQAERVKIEISNFNAAYFRLDRLKVQNLELDKKRTMFSVKHFDNAQKALSYMTAFEQNTTKLKQTAEKRLSFFPISYDNYARFFKDKRVEPYQKWFEENY